MPKIDNRILRVLDANFNRSKEALRVCEDILRFVFDSEKISLGLKETRHQVSDNLNLLAINFSQLLRERNVLEDVGRKSFVIELKRKDVRDLFLANMQRAKESIRVLEEFSKLINQKAAVNFKKIRYRVYQFEKEAVKKFPSLSNPG